MFRYVCDPSSGSIELYLTEIIRSGSQMFVGCLVGVWQRNFLPVVCVYGTTGYYDSNSQAVVPYTPTPTPTHTPTHTHIQTHTSLVQNYAAKHRQSARKTSVNHYEFQSSTGLYSLMMDCIRSETCWSNF